MKTYYIVYAYWLLAIVPIILKIAGVINTSWFWTLFMIWAPFAITIGVWIMITLTAIVCLMPIIYKTWKYRHRYLKLKEKLSK